MNTYETKNGFYYGEFTFAEKSGIGVSVNLDGSIYIGSYVNGEYNGYGELTTSDGIKCRGFFKDSKLNGYGQVKNKIGTFVDGTMTNECSITEQAKVITFFERESNKLPHERVARLKNLLSQKLDEINQEKISKNKDEANILIDKAIKLAEERHHEESLKILKRAIELYPEPNFVKKCKSCMKTCKEYLLLNYQKCAQTSLNKNEHDQAVNFINRAKMFCSNEEELADCDSKINHIKAHKEFSNGKFYLIDLRDPKQALPCFKKAKSLATSEDFRNDCQCAIDLCCDIIRKMGFTDGFNV